MGAPAVGFFDSGMGGLSVARAFLRLRPRARTFYVADWDHCPYGGRPDAEILDRSRQLFAQLRGLGCGLVVIACNSASAVALRTLREENPGFPIVGMEPAVKPAAALSRTGAVGILATAHTLRGRLFRETAAPPPSTTASLPDRPAPSGKRAAFSRLHPIASSAILCDQIPRQISQRNDIP